MDTKLALLRYLQEIGYTDTIIDVRSARVRQLLGLQNNANAGEDRQMVNGEATCKRPSESQGRRWGFISYANTEEES